MRSLITGTLYLLGTLHTSVATGQQNTVLPEYPNSYEIVRDVVELPAGRQMGSGNAIDIDSQGNIWVFERCGGNNGACPVSDVDPVLQFSPEGNLLSSFGSGLFVWPHGIVVDEDDNLWIIDAGVIEGEKGNQIFKFSPQGTLLLELGEPGIRGDGPGQFNEPSDLAIGPDGTLYIVDGHINPDSNRRIVHMTADGEFIESWGSKGYGPLQFEGPHAIAVDSMAGCTLEIAPTIACRFYPQRVNCLQSGLTGAGQWNPHRWRHSLCRRF